MNVLTTEHKNLSSNPTKNDRAVTVTLFNVCLEQGIWPWSDSHVIFYKKNW